MIDRNCIPSRGNIDSQYILYSKMKNGSRAATASAKSLYCFAAARESRSLAVNLIASDILMERHIYTHTHTHTYNNNCHGVELWLFGRCSVARDLFARVHIYIHEFRKVQFAIYMYIEPALLLSCELWRL